MHQPYFDITEKLGEPLWWDENGVPRYKPFEPRLCANIYAEYAALLGIRCQGCRAVLPVAASWSIMDGMEHERLSGRKGIVWDENGKNPRPADGLPKQGDAGAFGYGDAPWHGERQCSGTTMTTDTVRVIEFWKTTRVRDWERLPEHEVHIGEDDEKIDV